ncbi:hypothetical protein GGI20_001050 [Coemansia sp. BCRC 34301]|nr:hypothetical protein GGI20_001050 [Coemansia sp. BCRC 34301]
MVDLKRLLKVVYKLDTFTEVGAISVEIRDMVDFDRERDRYHLIEVPHIAYCEQAFKGIGRYGDYPVPCIFRIGGDQQAFDNPVAKVTKFVGGKVADSPFDAEQLERINKYPNGKKYFRQSEFTMSLEKVVLSEVDVSYMPVHLQHLNYLH